MGLIPKFPGVTPVTSSGSFTALVGRRNSPEPTVPVHTATAKLGTAQVGQSFVNGNMAINVGVVSQPTGTITVADNNFGTGADLYIGPYHLVNGFDYAVGGSAALTATNIINAINQFQGISASSGGGGIVIVEWEGGPNDLVVFKAISRSPSHTNFTLSGDGFLALGSPTTSTFDP